VNPVEFLASHPFLFIAAILALNVAISHVRMGSLVREGTLAEHERARLTRAFALGLVLPFAALAAVQAPLRIRPFCFADLWTGPAAWTFGAVSVLTWAAVLVWTWRTDGPEVLARAAPVLLRGGRMRTYTPHRVRVWVTLLVAASVAGTAANYFVTRGSPLPGACTPGGVTLPSPPLSIR
jgi:hypothetical protein